MINFNLPLDPAVISSVAGQTGGVVGSSNVAGTLYVSVPILDPEFIQANLAFAQANTSLNVAQSALTTAQAAYNFANTISGAAFNQANAAFNQANAAYNTANVGNTFVYTGGTVSGNVRINGTLIVTGNTTIENVNITNISVNTTESIITTGNVTAAGVYVNGTELFTFSNAAFTLANNITTSANIVASSITVTSLKEVKSTVSANTIDISLGNYFSKTINSNTSFVVANVPPAGIVGSFILDLTNGGSNTIFWMANTKWSAQTAPTLTASGRDILAFFTYDSGTTWNGLLLSKDIR